MFPSHHVPLHSKCLDALHEKLDMFCARAVEARHGSTCSRMPSTCGVSKAFHEIIVQLAWDLVQPLGVSLTWSSKAGSFETRTIRPASHRPSVKARGLTL